MMSYLRLNAFDEPDDEKDSIVEFAKHLESKSKKITDDKYIRCKDCDGSFLFSIEEQKYFETHNLKHSPTRCHNCRVLRKAQSKLDKMNGADKRNTVSAIVCISCKSLTYVPFKPKGHSPIYCRYCMHKRKSEVV